MDRKRIQEWLRGEVLTLCTAGISREDRAIRQAADALYDKVALLVKQAERDAVHSTVDEALNSGDGVYRP